MTIDIRPAHTEASARHVPAPDGTLVTLDRALDDDGLRAWRAAAVSGGLPIPARRRWQQLRAGVVNMWEFDAAEYWSADGRAQFVGRNEQGKSTMMTMTTLTMLTGDLSPRFVDTFGESHRSFRYYLEPTEDPKDRRPTKDQLNRGWTWVEYGRLTDAGPEYFTTLLFVQARRTSSDLHKTWVTHKGPERVRSGLTLVREQATVTAAELPPLAGLDRHPRGSDYTKTVASVLFGFRDQQRLRTVVELLKTLRTPKLGNRLNPEWVIERIREALPPLAGGEIVELAEGWDQLGQIAKDRDSAREAQEAVTAYLRSAWNPWADAVLRRAADDLASAVTTYDDVRRAEGAARNAADDARTDLEISKAEGSELERQIELNQTRRNTLLESQEYRAAANAGRQVTELQAALDRARADERSKHRTAQNAAETAAGAHTNLQTLLDDVERFTAQLTSQVERVASAGQSTGLPAVPAWAEARDTQRILTAVAQRRGNIKQARTLAHTLSVASSRYERAVEHLQGAQSREQQRQQARDDAAAARETAGQDLSDNLERWAATLASRDDVQPPTVAAREQWLDAVLAAADQDRPAQILARFVRESWLGPASQPVTHAAVTADNNATQARRNAGAAAAEADRVAAEPTPLPADPQLWRRRTRPASGPGGAPLWQLLDPRPNLPTDQVAAIEAGLAGAGLLDAWVTADGVWSAERDHEDQVLTLDRALGPADGPTLGAVLTVADLARGDGPLAALELSANTVLDLVGWRPDPDVGEASGHGDSRLEISADGSWTTPATSGKAQVPDEGPSLLGASAQQSARERRIAELRSLAKSESDAADLFAAEAARQRSHVETLKSLAQSAPDDGPLVDSARTLNTATGELAAASHDREVSSREVARTETARDRENEALVRYAADHRLVVTRLADTDAALQDLQVEAERLTGEVKALGVVQRSCDQQQQLVTQLEAAAGTASAEADHAGKRHTDAASALQAARDALDATDQELLDEGRRLATRIADDETQRKVVAGRVEALSKKQGAAEAFLSEVESRRKSADENRSDKLTAWWVPIDAGLAAARGLDVDEARNLTTAVNRARHLKTTLKPRGWPDPQAGPALDSERDHIQNRLRDRLAGPDLIGLNNTLNRTGGRTATVEHDETNGLPQVQVRVDSSGTTVEPVEAARALEAKAAELGDIHDQKMHEVMQELLSSTFVEHLRNQVKATEKLIHDVNEVLGRHPTGTTRTVLRLQRKPAAGHAAGYQVLQRLLTDGVDSPVVQQQIQAFLTGQIRAAQDEGQALGRDWKELLGDKLDYRNWFSVVTQWKVLTSAKAGGAQQWHELTTQQHGKDSGGGKVMTMLQPLLATLATLYQASPTAPRPLWLDEAFDGVDAENTTSLLGMLVEFDFDFLLAGPKSLVASRHVPCAAVWMVNRAPAPLPGVDLGLWLYAAGNQERVEMGDQVWARAGDGSEPGGDPNTAGAHDDDRADLWS